ncbi:putative capsid protein [Avon-Heathcote Estuary associated circular virus 24]|uniref:Putative capsid protein n=1 Tax=Avon-Heathcote Estuary associated circular virus 24 TaxID=1618248 RepID=A0A0C5I9V6_9VIRU|nr:putative capsid protein [Avon-Heathcote Estuary associated circular virus 24]AJP36459.1 putative capsid protein [Avon-Heathcote Estuary associated circular virus 24]
MSAVVTYGPRAARFAMRTYRNRRRVATYARGARMALNLARNKRVRQAVGQAYRRVKRRKTNSFKGRAPRSNKQRSNTQNNQQLVVNHLESTIPSWPPAASDSDPKQGFRRGNFIMLDALKGCWTFKNSGRYPVTVHFACVQSVADANANAKIDFFSNPGGTDKYKDFVDSKNVFDIDKDCLGLNKNKFNILFHKKIYLEEGEHVDGANIRTYSLSESKYMKTIRVYRPIKKNIEFENKSTLEPLKNIKYLYWFVPRYSTDQPLAGQTKGERAVTVDHTDSVLYRDRL